MKIKVMERRGNRLHKVRTITTLPEAHRGLWYAYYGGGRYRVHNHEAEYLSGRGMPFIVVNSHGPVDEMGSMSRTRSSRASHGDKQRKQHKGAYWYYTVLIPSVRRGRTEWHPTERKGPFETLSRGAFRSQRQAVRWAREHLKGKPYRIKRLRRY